MLGLDSVEDNSNLLNTILQVFALWEEDEETEDAVRTGAGNQISKHPAVRQ